jgi:hypothetical protein
VLYPGLGARKALFMQHRRPGRGRGDVASRKERRLGSKGAPLAIHEPDQKTLSLLDPQSQNFPMLDPLLFDEGSELCELPSCLLRVICV